MSLLLKRDKVIQWSYATVCMVSVKMVSQSAFIEAGRSEKLVQSVNLYWGTAS